MVDVASNKTIEGTSSSSRITGGGLDIDEVSNVIVRNLRFDNSGDDCIAIRYGAENVWVDHCTFDSTSDGQLDITHAAVLLSLHHRSAFRRDRRNIHVCCPQSASQAAYLSLLCE